MSLCVIKSTGDDLIMKALFNPPKVYLTKKYDSLIEQPLALYKEPFTAASNLNYTSQSQTVGSVTAKSTSIRKVAVANKDKQSGIAVIEFTAVVAFFLTLILTIIDIGMYGYVKLTMQNAVREGARYAVTGQSGLDPDASSNREAAIIQKMTNSSNGLFSQVIEVDEIRVEDLDGNAVTGFGGPGDLIAIHLDCEWATSSPYILPFVDDGTYKFTVSAAMKNELF